MPRERAEQAKLLSRPIALVGYRGTGKTSVGRQVAARLGRQFIDLDAVVVQNAGRTIAEIFAAEGEAAFRDREQAAVRDAMQRNDVVATGGGVRMR